MEKKRTKGSSERDDESLQMRKETENKRMLVLNAKWSDFRVMQYVECDWGVVLCR